MCNVTVDVLHAHTHARSSKHVHARAYITNVRLCGTLNDRSRTVCYTHLGGREKGKLENEIKKKEIIDAFETFRLAGLL